MLQEIGVIVDICLVVLKLGISQLLFSDYKWTPFCLPLVNDLYPGMVVISFSNKL